MTQYSTTTMEHAIFPGFTSPIALSEIEPTMPRSDFSGSEFQELMTEFPELTNIVDSRIVAMDLDHQDHTYHKPMITEEDNAANQIQQSGENCEILDSIPEISNEIEVADDADPWNATEHEIWKELESIPPKDLLGDLFSANSLPQIQGLFLENHKMDYFGK